MPTAMRPLGDLVGESPGIVAIRTQIGRLLERHGDSHRFPPILIQGETGTGKGVLARAIHRTSARAEGPFVDVSCAAIPETLLEAELFGYERGAFTDARQAKAGLFQTAHGGTLFLDEVGLLPGPLQAKLLAVVQERVVRRLGGTRTEPVDVWIISATNEDLAEATRMRRFREDLYHRLAVLTVSLPPLRERGDDVLRLAEHFLARVSADYRLRPTTLTPDARAALLAYPWPGNVRELLNVIERAALLVEDAMLSAAALDLPTGHGAGRAAQRPAPLAGARRDGPSEREQLAEALRQTGGNLSRAATLLGMSRNTLRYRLEKHGLSYVPVVPDRPAAPAEAPVNP